MERQELRIPALDGFAISATLFRPIHGPKAAIVVNAAIGVRQGFYAPFAAYLRAAGYAVVTYDYRGIGRSRADVVRSARLHEWGECDFAGVLAWLQSTFPGVAIGCVGHSIGGQLLGLTAEARNLRAFLGIAAQSGYWRHWDKRYWPRLLFAWYIAVPLAARIFGRVPGFFTGGEDLPGPIACEWARWCRTPHYMSDDAGRPLRPFFANVTCPTLLYVVSDDRAYAPLPAVRALAECYSAAQPCIKVIRPGDWGAASIGHFGFFRREMPRPLWDQVALWFSHHLASADADGTAGDCREET